MKLALKENIRVEAQPKQEAMCPCCSKPVISKCGKQKIWHWAHKNLSDCDNWWEAETEWHRKWKDNFPIEWQEKIQFDEQTNEKHIADILTEHNLVVEFQHSHIDPTERDAREKFYKNMLWVVDGTRLQRDYPRFIKKFGEFKETNRQGFFIAEFIDEVFPKNWLKSKVPVLFDFQGVSDDDSNQYKTILWCLLPQTDDFSGTIVGFRRSDFIQIIKKSPALFTNNQPEQRHQVQQQIIFNSRRTNHRSGPLINWIDKKVAAGKWKPRRRF